MEPAPTESASSTAWPRTPLTYAAIAWVPAGLTLLLIGGAVVFQASNLAAYACLLIAAVLMLLQFLFGLFAVAAGLRRRRERGGIAAALLGLLAAAIGAVGVFYGGLLALFAGGGGWGRPLRIRGRQRHPELREGADWTEGERPDPTGLDEPTRRALEALWLHDAQKEHASVPAFARLSWLLAAAGAPAELLVWSQRAAIEEIDHAQRCFALASGYGGRSSTVEPMPDLLLTGLGLRGCVFTTLACESLGDGCLLEDFNADIAAECAAECTEPATRAVLLQIAREERSHAEFSWAVLAWALDRAPATVRPALAAAAGRLERYRRPTAVSWRKQPLVDAADPALLRRHGRLPDARWAEVWADRLLATRARLQPMLVGAGNPVQELATYCR